MICKLHAYLYRLVINSPRTTPSAGSIFTQQTGVLKCNGGHGQLSRIWLFHHRCRKAFFPDISLLDFILSIFTAGDCHIYEGAVNCLQHLILKRKQISSKNPAEATCCFPPHRVLLLLSERDCSHVALRVLSEPVWQLLEFRADFGLAPEEGANILTLLVLRG